MTDSLSVSHVNYEYPGVTRNCGGGGRVTQLLHRHLGDTNIDSSVITDTTDGHYSTFPVRHFSSIWRKVRNPHSDIIHGHFSLPSSLTLPIAKPDDTRIIISVMGADVFDPTRFAAIRPLADRANSYLFKRADAVVVPSQDMERHVRTRFGIEPHHIPYGIETDAWAWRRRQTPDTPHILSVCRLVPRKNLDVAINAVRALRATGIDATYEIVGTGPLESELKQTHEYDWLTFAGYVDDLQAAHDRADLFFLPSKHEAFGMVFLEALASGLPVVTSDSGGQTDIVSDDVGRCVEPTVGALRDAMTTILNSYRRYQDATRGYVDENFSAKSMTDSYYQLYREVLR